MTIGAPETSSPKFDYVEIDRDEMIAIRNYDYEKAMFLAAAREEMQQSSLEEVTRHYQHELDAHNAKLLEELSAKKVLNATRFREDCQEALDNLRTVIDEMAASQRQELDDLAKQWNEARDFHQKQIQTAVDALLASSQRIAEARKYQEAIELRDKARALERKKRHPRIEDCDRDFECQFQDMLQRHELAFDELIAQHDAMLRLLNEKKVSADKVAEAESMIGEAFATVDIIDAALCDKKNADITLPIVKHFSPRAAKKTERENGTLGLARTDGSRRANVK
jgi:hypothetical protein